MGAGPLLDADPKTTALILMSRLVCTGSIYPCGKNNGLN
ncbi:hypothetical protein JCM19294_1387 [Nonlabens tegetincola]|uniref:Uncharacterized protein n=1 Tax=Nonlabens tegetincola TaxID=323273 RepID=A0A090QPB1_9FLAO|nr:hypothetical protein JCM19294_1387 [Nonlabens tegetincola]